MDSHQTDHHAVSGPPQYDNQVVYAISGTNDPEQAVPFRTPTSAFRICIGKLDQPVSSLGHISLCDAFPRIHAAG